MKNFNPFLEIQSLPDFLLIIGFLVFCLFCFFISLLPKKINSIAQIILGISIICYLSFKSFILLTVTALGIWFAINNHKLFNSKKLRLIGWSLVCILIFGKILSTVFYGKGNLINVEFLGISFYCFRLASCCFDEARSRKKKKKISAINFFQWIYFLPIFIAGPIQRFNEFVEPKIDSLDRFTIGLERICKGIVFKFFIADVIFLFLSDGVINGTLTGKGFIELTDTSCAWLVGPFSFLKTYFDFMGLSHIAIGIGLLFGIQIPENFKMPLLASDLMMFWKQWHMTLSRWCIDYVFTPTLLQFRNQILSVFICFLFIGVWHEASAGWFVWGILHGMGICLSGYLRSKRIIGKGGILATSFGVFLTLTFVMLVFVLVCGVEWNESVKIYQKMLY